MVIDPKLIGQEAIGQLSNAEALRTAAKISYRGKEPWFRSATDGNHYSLAHELALKYSLGQDGSPTNLGLKVLQLAREVQT